MLTSFKRIIGLGWQNLSRDSGIAVANVFIIMIPILLTSAIFILKDVSNFLVKSVQEKADISVYFNESVSEDNILKVKDEVSQIPGISQVKYKSKDQALNDFTDRHKDNAVLIESLQEVNSNPFLASLSINAVSMEQYEQVANLLMGQDYKDMVNKVDYSEKKDVIEKIFSLTSLWQRIGLALFAVLGAISIMVTFNTVRMAILSRGVEVGIQRLVGASRWFIRGQFLVEGLLFGLMAAIISFFATLAFCFYANSWIATVMPGMNLWQSFLFQLWYLLGIEMAVGAFLGAISSALAITRHLKV